MRSRVSLSIRAVCINTQGTLPPGICTWLKNNECTHMGGKVQQFSQWVKAEQNVRVFLLPVTFSERFAALPPRDQTPRRHLGLALDEHISSYLHQRLAPQLVVSEIWGNSWDKSSILKTVFVSLFIKKTPKVSLIIHLKLNLSFSLSPFSKMSSLIRCFIPMVNSRTLDYILWNVNNL